MRFYGHGKVWDKERSKALCTFDKNGEYETEDERTIALLKQGGYLGDYDSADFSVNEDSPVNDNSGEVDLEKMSYTDLRALCKEKGLTGYGKLNTDQLRALLEMKES